MELIQKSLTGKRWVLRSETLVGQSLFEKLLEGRIDGAASPQEFLEPKISKSMPNPNLLPNLQLGAQEVLDAIKNNLNIGIFGDYDVDGITSCAILSNYIKTVTGRLPVCYLPKRSLDGYGPSMRGVEYLISKGTNICIFVDCGSSNKDVVTFAMEHGMRVLVLDHHMAPCAIHGTICINPNLLNHAEEIPIGFKNLCAAGLCFVFISFLSKLLENAGIRCPDPFSYLGMAALGTMCDVMPMTFFNRAIIRQGIKVLEMEQHKGLRMLCKVSRLGSRIQPEDLNFALGPRINACGRLNEPYLALQLLQSQHTNAFELAVRIDKLNRHRQVLQQNILRQIRSELDKEARCVFAYGPWHIGIIGIIAGRLADEARRPSVIIGHTGHGELHTGSMRSPEGCMDAYACINKGLEMKLLENGGGHARAGGFRIRPEKIEAFNELCQSMCSEDKQQGSQPYIIDACVSVGATTKVLQDILLPMSPFGACNPEPLFALDITPRNVKVNKGHINFVASSKDKKDIWAVFFNAPNEQVIRSIAQNKHLRIISKIKPGLQAAQAKLELVDVAHLDNISANNDSCDI